MTSGHRTFRKDIQGLRALAVLAVILNHLGVPGLGGGFIGVDVFFTLSGYLITHLIMERLQTSRFSLMSFYKNRFWRLFPALAVTIATTLLVAVLLYPVVLILETAQSSLAALFSVSNLYFFMEAGYWDYTSKFKPLLHTWSLGLEEQYYLLYPLVLMVSFSKQWSLKTTLMILGGVSLLSSVLISANHPDAAFYLLPFRVFEFCLGGLVCFVALPESTVNQWSKVAGPVCLLMIAGGISGFEYVAAFPSWWPLIPCLACAVLLVFKTSIITRLILENPVMVSLGNLSYSWYLVHWPVVVFYLFVLPEKPTFADQVMMFSGSLILAIVLHVLIEQPFRRRRRSSPLFTIFAMLLICVVLWVVSKEGQLRPPAYPVQQVMALPAKAANIQRHSQWFAQCHTNSRGISRSCLVPVPEKSNWLVVGDSHGIDGYNIMKFWQPEHHYLLMSEKGCPPLLEVNNRFPDICQGAFARVLEHLQQHPEISTVVYSIRLDASRLPALRASLELLTQRPVEVLVLGVGPQYNEQTRLLAHNATSFTQASQVINQKQLPGLFELNRKARQVVELSGGRYLDKLAYFCPQQQCRVFTEDQKEMVTYDRNHLSLGASIDFARYLTQTSKQANEQ